MRSTLRLLSRSFIHHSRHGAAIVQSALIKIDNATFYRKYPTSTVANYPLHPPLFPNLTFSIPSSPTTQQHWAVIGRSNAGKTTFLEILRGHHVSIPPTARSYPHLSSPSSPLRSNRNRSPFAAIQNVGFDARGGGLESSRTRGAYMSARYESRKEETDFSLMDYLTGNTELNAYENELVSGISSNDLSQVVRDLKLHDLLGMPVGNLSNGQTRRARIAKALLGKPELLLLDEPFMGLDPPTQATISQLLFGLARESSPRLLLSLRPQDPIPDWITHLICIEPSLRIGYSGSKAQFLSNRVSRRPILSITQGSLKPSKTLHESSNGSRASVEAGPQDVGEPVVQMNNVLIQYGGKKVLGDWMQETNGVTQAGLNWMVRKGERWGVFGPNGSGKTTLISLICSDHPQAYSLAVRMFGRGRLPQPGRPGISIFDIQARIGHSSPEIQAFFPRNHTLRQVIQNAWAETFLGTPTLTDRSKEMVDAILRWFERELNPRYDFPQSRHRGYTAQLRSTGWADQYHFRDISFSSQRLLLFLRAVAKRPELVVLDEAFGGMDEVVRDKCMLFLAYGTTRSYGSFISQRDLIMTPGDVPGIQINGLDENQALICVSHVKEEVPDVVSDWLCLPEAGGGRPARFGRLRTPLRHDEAKWKEIWGM